MGKARVQVSELSPNPTNTGQNEWVFRVFAADGSPVSGARLTLRPTMEQHGHGTVPDHFEAREEVQGVYRIGPFNVSMPGEWAMELTLDHHGAAPVSTVFHVCVRVSA